MPTVTDWILPDPLRAGALAFDALLAAHAAPAAIAARRARRLAALMAAARRSAYYRARFARHGERFADQPPVHKAELMAHFSEWVTDPPLALPALRAFVADPARIGRPFAGRYAVWESSGSTGVPGLFVQDADALAVYDVLEGLRRYGNPSWRQTLDPFHTLDRIAFVGATGGHFASNVSVLRLAALVPAMRLAAFSFLAPRAELARALEAFGPTIVATYPSAAVQLADDGRAGMLRLPALREVWTGGEALSDAMRGCIAQAFGCGVRASYGASEFLAIASECDRQRLHVNADWVILEPVDDDGRPVPPGETGARVWLTNLANHVQPLVRYDLGDRVRIAPGSCGCGITLPVVEVEGRVDDALVLHGPGTGAAAGRVVRVSPLALVTVLEEDARITDFQLVQRGPRALALTVGGAPADAALAAAHDALAAFLRTQGLAGVRIAVRRGTPALHGRSGKTPRVVGLPG